MYKILSFAVSLLLSTAFLAAQNGTIAGKIIDAKTSEALTGCSVKLMTGAGGSVSDIDGQFRIGQVIPGRHTILVRYTGYQEKSVEGIVVTAGNVTTVDITLEDPSSGTALQELVIVARSHRESQTALTILQKNSPVIADGISAETIKRTPDRTTGDVLRRVSGAALQDGRFAVIRGLNDRYNTALVNGFMLSSTEPDRRAFSFDIFPSALLDNLLIYKTAAPDLPGEFAGGAIILNTRDIPEKNYLQASVSAGYNTLTTFQPFQKAPGSSTDWTGMDDGTRKLPAAMPATRQEYLALTPENRYDIARTFSNSWTPSAAVQARPNYSAQITGGVLKEMSNAKSLGATFGLTYNNSLRFQEMNRRDFDMGGQLFDFTDKQYNNSILTGLLANIGYNLNRNNKIVFQNTLTVNTDNNLFVRNGLEVTEETELKSQAIEFTKTSLLTSQLTGEHIAGEKHYKVQWGLGLNKVERDAPDQRRFLYRRPVSTPGDEQPFTIFVPLGGGDPYRMGRTYLNLQENVYNAYLHFSAPFVIFGEKQTFKTGVLYQKKDRLFGGRLLGIIKSQNILAPGLMQQPIETIFDSRHFNTNGFALDDITSNADRYDAQSDLTAGYALLQNTLGDVKLNWGVRYEYFGQRLNSFDVRNQPVNIRLRTPVFLPSLNLTYALTEQQNLRFCASKTVSRPEFRELAPFTFFDFVTQTLILGNPSLKSARVYNADLRYEWYPGENQLLSASVFYKYFRDPIEQIVASSGATTRTRTFSNVANAQNYGIELEARYKLGFIHPALEQLTAFGNLSLIRSRLDLSKANVPNPRRPLQGQSPYVANVGMTLTLPQTGIASTLVYNMVGDRIFEVGFFGYADVYERHRPVLDWQISKSIGRRMEVKLNWQDMLSPDILFYQDNEPDGKFTDKPTENAAVPNDYQIQRIKVGSTISVSVGYRL